jgi:hypothetical protein
LIFKSKSGAREIVFIFSNVNKKASLKSSQFLLLLASARADFFGSQPSGRSSKDRSLEHAVAPTRSRKESIPKGSPTSLLILSAAL